MHPALPTWTTVDWLTDGTNPLRSDSLPGGQTRILIEVSSPGLVTVAGRQTRWLAIRPIPYHCRGRGEETVLWNFAYHGS